jgi:FixJ family two-component response regulator
MRVLIADDDDGYRFPIKNVFEDNEYQIVEARNKQEVMTYAPEATVWIIDVRLPTGEMEGIKAVLDLAREGNKPKCPVVFISVMSESDVQRDLAPLRQSGVDFTWLEKPFEVEFLFETVKGSLCLNR